eukprot:2766677-Pleurochrysis_carterae.AAC.1
MRRRSCVPARGERAKDRVGVCASRRCSRRRASAAVDRACAAIPGALRRTEGRVKYPRRRCSRCKLTEPNMPGEAQLGRQDCKSHVSSP